MNAESEFSEPPPAPSAPDSDSAAPKASVIRTVFVGFHGIRAGWRFLIFAVLFVVFSSAATSALVRIPVFARLRKEAVAGTLTPAYLVVFEVLQFGMALLAAAIMSWIEKRKVGEYGIPLRGAFGKRFSQGAAWGLVFVSGEMLAMAALGGFSFGGLALAGPAIVKDAAVWALAFVLVGFAEEFVYRGYAQFTLASGIRFWPAAVLLSGAFGAVHLFNPSETWVGAASVVTFGLFACFTLRRTGSLWFAIGFHAASDYAETFLYSVPDSGERATGQLLHSSLHGPSWLTGGVVGPEGSVLDFVALLLAFAVFAWMFPPRKSEPSGGTP
jgi:membrane protease YdiL (CAAX protease family)